MCPTCKISRILIGLYKCSLKKVSHLSLAFEGPALLEEELLSFTEVSEGRLPPRGLLCVGGDPMGGRPLPLLLGPWLNPGPWFMFLFLLGIWKRIPPEFGPSKRQKQLVSKTSEMHTEARKISYLF